MNTHHLTSLPPCLQPPSKEGAMYAPLVGLGQLDEPTRRVHATSLGRARQHTQLNPSPVTQINPANRLEQVS